MCGISGFVGAGAEADLRRMTASLAHRGPDDEGFWSDPGRGVHLGHRRLSVLDLDGGRQPMRSADGDLVVVFNGEIYNFAELRAELAGRGHRFVTDHSDTEVLLHGYREWGAGLPRRLNGMWAFALHDRAAGRLFCSRDRFGKKPFFYTAQHGAFVFASELSALRLHPAVRSGVSPRALRKYFGYGYIPAPSSILENVFKLPGGHSLSVDTRTLEFRLEKYWDFVLDPFVGAEIPPDAENAWSEELRARLETAVRRRLVADVPVGVFLSGGIDSSAVTAFAARHVPAGRLRTFSVGFEEKSFDESAAARRVASLFQTEHHAAVFSLEGAHAQAAALADRLDEPMGDSSLLPTSLLCAFARRQVTVALGGDGGDELFAGYDPFRALRLADAYQKFVPRPVHRAVALLAARLPVSHGNMSLDFRLKRTLRGLDQPARLRLPVWMAPLSADDLAALSGEPVDLEDVFSEAIAAWEGCAQPDPVDRALQFYTKLYLQDDILVKIDRASMWHGLEVRAPLLDLDLVNFVRRLPASCKFRRGCTKYLLKRALAPVLPADVLHRKKKGFGAPVGAWFRDGRLGFDLAAEPGREADFIAAKLARHRSGQSDERAFLWNAFVYRRWRSAFPRAHSPA